MDLQEDQNDGQDHRIRPALDESQAISQQMVEYSDARKSRADQASSSMYYELLHSITDSVIFTDLTGSIFEVNPRTENDLKLSGKDCSSLHISTIVEAMQPDLIATLCDSVGDESFAVVESMCARGDGSHFHAEVVINKFHGYEEEALCFFVRDVTERKVAEKQIEDDHVEEMVMENIRSRMDTLSTVFYELNNPLQILMSLAENDSNSQYKTQLNRIVESLNRLRENSAVVNVVDEAGTVRYTTQTEDEIRGVEPILCDSGRVLIVDDEKLIRSLFVTAMTHEFPDLIIDTAENGQEAVDLFCEHRHGAVVMDVSMPVLDGHQAFAEIQATCERSGWKMPPVIFCTGYAITSVLTELIGDQSYHAYLIKPFRTDALTDIVRHRLCELYGREA